MRYNKRAAVNTVDTVYVLKLDIVPRIPITGHVTDDKQKFPIEIALFDTKLEEVFCVTVT